MLLIIAKKYHNLNHFKNIESRVKIVFSSWVNQYIQINVTDQYKFDKLR